MVFSVPCLCPGYMIFNFFFVSYVIPVVMADKWAALAVSETLPSGSSVLSLVAPPLSRAVLDAFAELSKAQFSLPGEV